MLRTVLFQHVPDGGLSAVPIKASKDACAVRLPPPAPHCLGRCQDRLQSLGCPREGQAGFVHLFSSVLSFSLLTSHSNEKKLG